MKPTNDIPTGTDLLIEKIDDLIEVIKYLTATIKKERHDISECHRPLTIDGGDPLTEEIYRARTVRRADPESGDLPYTMTEPIQNPMPDAPYDSTDRTDVSTNIYEDRGAWCSDIAYSDLTYSTVAGNTTISSIPRSYSLNGIRCGIDMGVDSAGRDCSSTEVSNERG